MVGPKLVDIWLEKTIYTSGSIVNIKIQEMKQYVYAIASTEHMM
jgi:hypothetical protein